MKKKIILVLVIIMLIGNIAYAEDMIFTRSLVERNNGEVHWNNGEKRIDISLLDKKVSIWIDKEEILIDNKIEKMNYKPILLKGQTVLPKEFYSKYLGIEETYKDNVKKQINYKIKTKPEISWETGEYLTKLTNNKANVTSLEILERIQEIIYYLENNVSKEIDITDMQVTIYEGLESNNGILGRVLRNSRIVSFYGLDYPNYLNFVVNHEIGHYIDDKFLTDEDFEEYKEFRGLDNEYFNGETWGRDLAEVFAEDFVSIFIEDNYNTTEAPTLDKEQIEEFRQFIFGIIIKGE